MFCNRPLWDRYSVEAGMGDQCMKKYGLGFDNALVLDAVRNTIASYPTRNIHMQDDTTVRQQRQAVLVLMRTSSSLAKHVMENTENGADLLEMWGEGMDEEGMVEWARRMCQCDHVEDFERALRNYAVCIASGGKWLPLCDLDDLAGGLSKLVDVAVLCVHFKHDAVDKALKKCFDEVVFPHDGSVFWPSLAEITRDCLPVFEEGDEMLDVPLAKRRCLMMKNKKQNSVV
jgi:hypothetical protein